MEHVDVLFRFTCPHCDTVNAPVVEFQNLVTAGVTDVVCVNCRAPHKIAWGLSVTAELMDEEIDVEAIIWEDDDEEDDDDEDDGDEEHHG